MPAPPASRPWSRVRRLMPRLPLQIQVPVVHQQGSKHHDPRLCGVMGIRPVDAVHEIVDAIPVEFVPQPPVVPLALHHDIVQDSLEVGQVESAVAVLPLEPLAIPPAALFHPAPHVHHVDEQPVRRFHVRGVGGDPDSEQLVVQIHQLASDGVSPCAQLRAGRHVSVDSGEQASLRVGHEVEISHDDRTAHLHRVPLGHPRHHRCDVACPLRDSVRIDAAVEKPIVLRQPAERPSIRLAAPAPASPLVARNGGGLAVQLLRSEQPSGPGVAKRDPTHRIGVLDGVRTEPLREHELDQQILEIVSSPAGEAAPESSRSGALLPWAPGRCVITSASAALTPPCSSAWCRSEDS